jgi:hypothetical protein
MTEDVYGEITIHKSTIGSVKNASKLNHAHPEEAADTAILNLEKLRRIKRTLK